MTDCPTCQMRKHECPKCHHPIYRGKNFEGGIDEYSFDCTNCGAQLFMWLEDQPEWLVRAVE